MYLVFWHRSPNNVVSKSGPQNTSATFKDLLEQQGIQQVLTTRYNSQSNGLAENFIRTLNPALKNPERKRKKALRQFLQMYRTVRRSTKRQPPCEMLNKPGYRTSSRLMSCPKSFVVTHLQKSSHYRKRRERCISNKSGCLDARLAKEQPLVPIFHHRQEDPFSLK